MLFGIISFIGFLFLLKILKDVGLFLFNMWYGPKRNLSGIYGKGSYVLITGGSEGIGEEFAIQFAKKGFNLILVSRSLEKLTQAKEKIQKEVRLCIVHTISFDFSTLHNMEDFDFSKAWGLDLRSIDISVLVNNVGIGSMGQTFYEYPIEKIQQMIEINCLSQTLMSSYIIRQMVKRNNRSCIVHVSSMSAVRKLPFLDLYGATKRFNYHFGRSMTGFYGKVDVYNYMPSYVDTAMTQKIQNNKKISTQESVSSAMNNIGSFRTTFAGHWKHELATYALSIVPEFVLVLLITKLKIKI